MNNQAWPWPFVDCLIQHFDLNECEAADLSDRAQRLLDASVGRPTSWKTVIIERLWVRANSLYNQGSPMQTTWDTLTRAKK
ncbi:hypothetical protein LCGC14_2694930 [marine sediment metagenome]|uniref:Uncharacterized protein n=1 Tax=marine sediment metagenome TaxID=412755 RepID=A0A0F9C964_9ZZZZ